MKSTFDVMDLIFPVVNVGSVTTTLDGRVYRNARPIDSTTRDIVILNLLIAGGTDIDLQDGTIIVNCFAKDIDPGILDDANLDTMTAAVLAVLEAYSSSTEYLHLEIVSQSVFEDIDQAGTSYSSIRINYTIQYKAP